MRLRCACFRRSCGRARAPKRGFSQTSQEATSIPRAPLLKFAEFALDAETRQMLSGLNAPNSAHHDSNRQRKILLTEQLPFSPLPHLRTEVRHCHNVAHILRIPTNESRFFGPIFPKFFPPVNEQNPVRGIAVGPPTDNLETPPCQPQAAGECENCPAWTPEEIGIPTKSW